MPWFAAHAVMCNRWKDQPQRRFKVWEIVFLVEGQNEEDGMTRAIDHGLEYASAGSQGNPRSEGHPVKIVFEGIRKVLAVAHLGWESELGDGDEITYMEFEVDGEESVRALAAGKAVEVAYRENEPS